MLLFLVSTIVLTFEILPKLFPFHIPKKFSRAYEKIKKESVGIEERLEKESIAIQKREDEIARLIAEAEYKNKHKTTLFWFYFFAIFAS